MKPEATRDKAQHLAYRRRAFASPDPPAWVERHRARQRANDRATRRLIELHREEFERLRREELDAEMSEEGQE